MEKTCPQCGAPLKIPENKNRMVDEQLIKCEYCGYSYKIDPEFKKLNTTVTLLKRCHNHVYSDESMNRAKKQLKFSLIGFLGLGIFVTLMIIIFTALGI